MMILTVKAFKGCVYNFSKIFSILIPIDQCLRIIANEKGRFCIKKISSLKSTVLIFVQKDIKCVSLGKHPVRWFLKTPEVSPHTHTYEQLFDMA